MKDPKLEELLDKCIAYHGHLCMGQVLGVRLAVKGLSLAAPSTYKDLIVVVENDRCIADAIQTVTGTRLGRRSSNSRLRQDGGDIHERDHGPFLASERGHGTHGQR